MDESSEVELDESFVLESLIEKFETVGAPRSLSRDEVLRRAKEKFPRNVYNKFLDMPEEDSEEEIEVEVEGEKVSVLRTIKRPKDQMIWELVDYVKSLITLVDFKEKDWSQAAIENVEYFLTHLDEKLLVVYYDGDQLVLEFCIPSSKFETLTYFLRVEKLRLKTRQNFHRSILYGTLDQYPEESLLHLLEGIYGPYVFNLKNYPANIKSDLCYVMNDLVLNLRKLRFSMTGLNGFYIPPEIIPKEIHKACKNLILIKRLDTIILRIYTEIRVSLNDIQFMPPEDEPHPLEVFQFWIYKFENLCSIWHQLKDPVLAYVCKILLASQSNYIKDFISIFKEVKVKKEEARCNVSYLKVMIQPCIDLYNVNQPSEIPEFIPQVLFAFKFIWMNAPYFSSIEQFQYLLLGLSNQIVYLCKRFLDFSLVIEKKPRQALILFRSVVYGCVKYKQLYQQASSLHNKYQSKKWDVNPDIVFNQIDTLVQRCRDVIEVCETLIIFGRIDDFEEIPKPTFGWTLAKEYVKTIDKIESKYWEYFKYILEVQDTLLLLYSNDWPSKVLRFREGMRELELLIENLLEYIFQTVINVEEGIEVLQTMYQFSKRSNLYAVFEKHTLTVYNLMLEEILDAKSQIAYDKKHYNDRLQEFSGRALLFKHKKNRIRMLYNNLMKAEWMVDCGLSDEVTEQLNLLESSYDREIALLYNKWVSQLGSDLADRIEQPLFKKSSKVIGLIEVNVDPMLKRTVNESRFWRKLSKPAPTSAATLIDKFPQLLNLEKNIELVASLYNSIMMTLSDTERELFNSVLKQLERQIAPGFTSKYQWNHDTCEIFINECIIHLQNLTAFIEEYKLANHEIDSLCKKLTLVNFNNAVIGHIYDLESYSSLQEEGRAKSANQIREYVEQIGHYLKIVKDGFEPYLVQMLSNWYCYLKRIDKTVEKAILRCVTISMEDILLCVKGAVTAGPTISFRVSSFLRNGSISCQPSCLEFVCLMKNTLPDIALSLRSVERVITKFSVKVDRKPLSYAAMIAINPHINTLQLKIEREMAISISLLKEYAIEWIPFKEVWEIDKTEFLARYELFDPDSAAFNNDITRFLQYTDDVGNMLPFVNIKLFLVDSRSLRESIIEHCNKWHQCLTNLLMKVCCRKIEDIYRYCDVNTAALNELPKNQYEVAAALELQRKLASEIPLKEMEFPKLKEQLDVLMAYKDDFPPMLFTREGGLQPLWEEYKQTVEDSDRILKICQADFRSKLVEQGTEFRKTAQDLLDRFHLYAPTTREWDTIDALKRMRLIYDLYMELLEVESLLKRDLNLVQVNYNQPAELDITKVEMLALQEIWELTLEWEQAWARFKNEVFWEMKSDDIESTIKNLLARITAISKEQKDKNWTIIEHTKQEIDAFKRVLPLITDLKNKAMRERHWNAIKAAVKQDFDENSPNFTLEYIMSLKMQDYGEEISEIAYSATMELNIEKALAHIRTVWKDIILETVPHKVKKMYKVKINDELFFLLDEHLSQISSMKGTRFIQPFIEEANYWEKHLTVVLEVLEASLQVQKNYFYLENIFSGEDIQKQLPKECDDFFKVMTSWAKTTSDMRHDKYVFVACHRSNLLKILNKMVESLERIQKALEYYLENKRHIFPRFYFISNEDLLEIFGNSKKPELIQPHFKNLFDNLHKVTMFKTQMTPHLEGKNMISGDGEVVEWRKNVSISGNVELWLCAIEDIMRLTLRDILKECRVALKKCAGRREKWIKEWPGQTCIVSSQIQWAIDCTRTLMLCETTGKKKPLKKLKKKQNQILEKYLNAIRSSLSKIERLKVIAVVTIEIHGRDVMDKMYKLNVTDTNSFEWISQLRHYWDKDVDDCVIRQTNTHFAYGYEYLGNSGRLVITPLTDRCYITLTTALHLYRGGCPKGPAGTGKTETVKDLGKGLGYYVIVINCSEGLDFKSMGRMFSGLAQTGAWGCFDEFNRINIEVLSVVAQQILSILSALAAKVTKFSFEGYAVKLVHNCGIFVTMNPGYAGRTDLPDNLKSMFRPISMMSPDTMMIAEITLFSEGFRNSRVLARKIDTQFSLCLQQLSKQHHYDFGLRGMVSVLRYAGRKRRQYPDLSDDEILLLAMKDMNIAKLTIDDTQLFTGITRDLFPYVELPVLDYEVMYKHIREVMDATNLQPIPFAMTKVIQLYETKGSRHSVMLIGDSGSGKSATWKTLKSALTSLKAEGLKGYESVQEYIINPKALNLGELYGYFDLGTNEWMDGVVSSIMRKTCNDESLSEKWIVFDGPVDAVWIENMNSVMDDNKILTLINSERIGMPEQVSLLFEVDSLVEASPATVSRCGIVFNDINEFGWRPFVTSWLSTKKIPSYSDCMGSYFEKYLDPLFYFKKLNTVDLTSVPELSQVVSLCRLLEAVGPPEKCVPPSMKNYEDGFRTLTKLWFLFCLTWSVGATVNEAGREKYDMYIREMETVIPLKDTIYEYFVNSKELKLSHWEEVLSDNWSYDASLPFFKIIVPTVDTVRYEYLAKALLTKNIPVLLTGIVGTGKTFTAYSVAQAMGEDYSVLGINMSSQTTSKNMQDIIESRLEKRTKGVFCPIGGKILIALIDDFNMPKKEQYGAQPPLELIRQWLNYGFWYNRSTQQTVTIRDMLIMACMGPPGGGRTDISKRLLTKFSVINMAFPSDSQIVRIFNSILAQHFAPFDGSIRASCESLTRITLQMYKEVISAMLPTPAKMHYLFNMRDMSKIIQGIVRSTPEYLNSKSSILRLWIHEAFRVFADRIIDEHDYEWFQEQVNIQLGMWFDTTFHGLCPSKEIPVFSHLMNPEEFYEDISNFTAFKEFLDKKLSEYAAIDSTFNVVLFKEAVEHICRYVRIISQARGHVLLVGIGGSGRNSLARLSIFLCRQQAFELQMSQHYGMNDFKEDWKRIYFITGIKELPLTFLFKDNQVLKEEFFEIINNVLGTGEVTNLYDADEFDEVKEFLYQSVKKAGIVPSTEAVYNYFIDRVRTNLHIILCMSPVGDAFRKRIRQYPSFINCTTIDWLSEWPQSALMEVALSFMKDIDMQETISGVPPEIDPRALVNKQEKFRRSAATVVSLMHDSVRKYSQIMYIEMLRHNYVTAVSFLELVTVYKQMLASKRQTMAEESAKFSNGLTKIDETSVKVTEMSVELEKATVEVAQMNKECDDFLVLLMTQKREADEQQKVVAANSEKIAEEELECQEMADIALADLQEAMPALEEAIKALEALNKKDMSEIKSYGRPPAKVEMVMEAVMIMKKSDPTWAEAKRQLGDVNFLNQLKDFDKDHISDKTLRKIANYTQNPEFDPEKVGAVSVAAKSLAMWVIAIEKYGKIYRIVAPKKMKVDEAMGALRAKQEMLADAKRKLDQLHQLIARLKRDYDEKMQMKEELRKKAEMLTKKLERAANLLDGLSGERVRWAELIVQLEKDFDLLIGDCLMATAFISYMGPFVTHFRENLISEWMTFIRNEELPHNPEFSPPKFLVDPAIIRDWNLQGLPIDIFSSENGIIVKQCSRWPLVIDPQNQGFKWIKNMESNNGLKVIDFATPNYLRILEHAMGHGIPILIKNCPEQFDLSVIPYLTRNVVERATKTYIKVGDRYIEQSKEFKLFMTTKLSNPHFAPEVCTKTTLINFALKEEGLQDQLLGLVVREDKPRLEQIKDSLVVNIAAGKKTLKNLESEILRLLNESTGSLLDNDELYNTLKSSKETATAVAEQLEVSLHTENEIDSVRHGYNPCALRASILFFVLNDMSRIDPMYQWSLEFYQDIFISSIKKSKKSDDLEERILSLNDYHTFAVFRHICRGVFEHHKLLFAFYICVKIMENRNEIQSGEYQYLLKGGVVVNREEQPENPAPDWIPEIIWDNITELDKVRGFHGLLKSFEFFTIDWKHWYFSPSPENLELVGEWELLCTSFQKILFIRALRPDRLSFCLSNFVSEFLGNRFIEPMILEIKSVLEDSNNRTPLIFVLSPGVDPTNQLLTLAENSNLTNKFKTLSLGQGQAPLAKRLIEQGVIHGHWIFLANCHLSISWMPDLDKLIDSLQANKDTHPDFRLWLSSSPTPDFPIAILQSSIKMTTEPPKGVKANMKRLFNLVPLNQFAISKNPYVYKKLVYALCFFHSVILERKKFQQLGWNVVYSFNDSDFEVSENILTLYLDDYKETPWEALKYLVAGIFYGGHVTDDWDRRLLLTYIHSYFNYDAANVPFYRLSSLPHYYIPEDTEVSNYQTIISNLPSMDDPALFGQHPNASINSLIIESQILCETLMSMECYEAASSLANKEQKVFLLSEEILAKLPRQIDLETTERNVGFQKTPIDVVLLQEIVRYNSLLATILQSLQDLQKGIKGLTLMSVTLEDVFANLYDGKVPPSWGKVYQSMKSLGSWSRDLYLRVEYFNKWAERARPPSLFWLSAFSFPTSFLTAVLQMHGRTNGVTVDTLGWEFTPMSKQENEMMLPSQDGIFVRGMFLEGAGWDNRSLCLSEPEPMQLVVNMPVIQFRPCEVLKKKSKGLYCCPVYYYPMRATSFVLAIDLKSGEEGADHWIKRAAAILLSLST